MFIIKDAENGWTSGVSASIKHAEIGASNWRNLMSFRITKCLQQPQKLEFHANIAPPAPSTGWIFPWGAIQKNPKIGSPRTPLVQNGWKYHCSLLNHCEPMDWGPPMKLTTPNSIASIRRNSQRSFFWNLSNFGISLQVKGQVVWHHRAVGLSPMSPMASTCQHASRPSPAVAPKYGENLGKRLGKYWLITANTWW